MEEKNNKRKIEFDDIDNASDKISSEKELNINNIDIYELNNENLELKYALEKAQNNTRTIEILDNLIEPYAKKSFKFMSVYCGIVGVFLFLHGFRVYSFSLPEAVLKFLVGSTATTVIGLVGMVLTGVFVGARRSRD